MKEKKNNSKSKSVFLVLLAALGFIVLAVLLAKVALSAVNGGSDNSSKSKTETAGTALSSGDITVPDDVTEKIETAPDVVTSDFYITTDVSDGLKTEGTVFTISKSGEYNCFGSFSDGQIIIDTEDVDDVTVILNGVNITCTTDSVIKVNKAENVVIKSAENTENYITDGRAVKSGEDDTVGDATVYSESDLTLSGSGTLNIYGNYCNAVHSKADLTVKKVTLNVTAVNNALKGNDSVSIDSGDLVLISTGGNGIKTKNSDVSSKGNQRGTVSISTGGSVVIYAACDGIDAAYDVEISDGDVYIYTDKYSSYTGEVFEGTESEFYIIVPTSVYSTSDRYAVYVYSGSNKSNGKWVDAEYYTMVSSGGGGGRGGMGGRTQYYCLKASLPSGYSSFGIYKFASGDKNSLDDYDACYTGSINSSMNAYLISSISGTTISGDWTNLSGTDSSTVSSKGIKAGNDINITGGVILVKSLDDALHANSGSLDSGETSDGNVNVTGGSLTLTSGDDGIHGDEKVTIGGNACVNVVTAYEGIEGNLIEINDECTVVVNATDDGLNACSGSATPCITVNGGYLDVTTPTGDTDAIDSNGSYVQNGGFVLVKGGSSSGSVSGSIDVDKTITVKGGTVIALGGICETPSNGSCYTVKLSRKSFAAGEYVIKDSDGNVVAEFTLEKSYTGAWISSALFEKGTTYTITKGGSSFTSWTQNSSTVSG